MEEKGGKFRTLKTLNLLIINHLIKKLPLRYKNSPISEHKIIHQKI